MVMHEFCDYNSGSQPVVRGTFLDGAQWWILGEANEAVASGPPQRYRI